MNNLISEIESRYKKKQVVAVRSGDLVRVTQRIKEANKERTQAFEGLVIRCDRKNSLTSRITVRKLVSSVSVEKSFLLHSPSVIKVEVLKRSKVRRNYLSYMRQRLGKSTRLKGLDFDRSSVNTIVEPDNDKHQEASEPVADAKPASKVSDEIQSPEVTEKAEKAKTEKSATETDQSGDEKNESSVENS